MNKKKRVEHTSRLTPFEKKWYKVTRMILICIAIYIIAQIIPKFEATVDNSQEVVILQYLPMCLTIALSLIGGAPALFRTVADNVVLEEKDRLSIRRLMTPRTKENSTELELLTYYIWEGIVILSQIILITLSISNASSFFDKLTNLVLGVIMGLISYVSLTGQGHIVAGEGKRKQRWTKGINPNAGREYVPGANAYRDANGNYYNLHGSPIATPVSSSKDK